MPFSTALDGSLPALWLHTAQTICKKSVTQETSLFFILADDDRSGYKNGKKRRNDDR
jgi:hypothetical protein